MDVKKADLIQQLMEREGYTKKAASDIVQAFSKIILENLEDGNTVSLRNFGCFDILERKERSCPNPQTGEKVVVPAHYIPRFYPGSRMRAAVKKWEDNVRRGLV